MDKKKAMRIYKVLISKYPGVSTALAHRDPYELLVATILSAQCTDKRVNMVTKKLFKRYRAAKDYVKMPISVLEKEIRSTGFYRNKAKNIIAASGIILRRFGGKVPDIMEELITLPGVARKTANIVLYHGFGRNEGIAVDTHVRRVSGRIGLSANTDPVKIERDLMPLFPRKDWGRLSDLFIVHGREVCGSRKPLCQECPIAGLCPSVKFFCPQPKK